MELLKYLSERADSVMGYAGKKYPDKAWMFKVQQTYWNDIFEAHQKGKKLVLLGACVPPEIIYAFDAVPLVMDAIATRLAGDPELIQKYIDIAEKNIPATVCGIDKADLGVILSGDFEIKPDAFLYSTVPCDSSRTVYPMIDRHLGVPSMCLDVPYRKDEFGFQYLADQMRDVVAFLEKTFETKLDWKKLEKVIELSNEATRLLSKIGELRRIVPCPLPGRLLVLNELYSSMIGSQAMVDYLQAQYDVGKAIADKGFGCVKEEKYRVTWLQNMVWSNVGIMDWLEKEYGAVVIMDGMGYDRGVIIDNVHDENEVYLGLAKRALATPMIHASSGPAQPWIDLASEFIDIYKINMSMFIGHVGCKHTWAAGKLVKDAIQDKFGIPSLTLDLDAIDGRYKTTEEIKATISEYIDTIGK